MSSSISHIMIALHMDLHFAAIRGLRCRGMREYSVLFILGTTDNGEVSVGSNPIDNGIEHTEHQQGRTYGYDSYLHRLL